MERAGLVVADARGLGELLGDLYFRLAEYHARLPFALGLGLSQHRILERLRNADGSRY
jgi:hypothetical protein